MIDTGAVLDSLAALQPAAPSIFKIATVSSVSGGHPILLFEGETVASTLAYPYLGSYTPTAADRVLVAMAGYSGVVLGKIN